VLGRRPAAAALGRRLASAGRWRWLGGPGTSAGRIRRRVAVAREAAGCRLGPIGQRRHVCKRLGEQERERVERDAGEDEY
jgi:hypothetical protein